MKKTLKHALYALIALVWILAAAVPAGIAASEPCILEQKVTQDHALVAYVRHTGGAAVETIDIGGKASEDVTVSEASATPIVTWLLIDNSTSMPVAVRQKAAKLIMMLVGEKSQNETYNFCTFSDRLRVILRNSGSFADIQAEVDKLDYLDQPTYLMGALDDLFSEEVQRSGAEFVRIVVISDGGDSTSSSRTVDNPLRRLSTSALPVSNIPIYTFGCDIGINTQTLPQMYALSDTTHARHWDLNDIAESDVARIMHWEEVPVRVNAKIPIELCNGSMQTVRATFADGTSVSDPLQTPILISVTPIPTPEEPTPEPTQEPTPTPVQEEEKKPMPVWLIIVLIVLALGLIGGGIAFFLLHRRKEDQIQAVSPNGGNYTVGGNYTGGGNYTVGGNYTNGGNYTGSYGGGYDNGKTDIMGDDNGGYGGGDETDILVSDEGPRMLCMSDQDHPEKQFNASLREQITIGRGPGNRIVIDYDRSVSTSHCVIFTDGAVFRIRDLGSANGTYVDGSRVADSVEISNGNMIRLGRLNFRVTIR